MDGEGETITGLGGEEVPVGFARDMSVVSLDVSFLTVRRTRTPDLQNKTRPGTVLCHQKFFRIHTTQNSDVCELEAPRRVGV